MTSVAMIKTTHVRAALRDVCDLIEQTLAAEGYRPSDVTLAPRIVSLGAETMTLPPEVPPHLRRVLVAEQNGWTAIADDPFVRTDWGKSISESLDSPVFTLEGERDHAFYSSVVVHEKGVVKARSDVPRDAVHEADGRHRIRPVFLAAYFPEAGPALELGIVIDKHGGEENVRAVADALSLPNALLSSGDETDGRVTMLFEMDPERAEPAIGGAGAFHGALAEMFGQMASEMEPETLAAFGMSEMSDPSEMASAMLMQLGATAGQAALEDEPLALDAPSSSHWSGFAGDTHQCHTTFRLRGGGADGPRDTRGLTIRVTGAGLRCFEVTTISVLPTGSVGNVEAPRWDVTPERDGDTVVVHVPEIEMSLPSPAPNDALLSPRERLRRRMQTPIFAGLADNRAEIVVYLSGKLVGEGKGPIEIHGETTPADGVTLRATSKNAIEVKPALRVPVLPDWVDDAHLRANRHDLAEYEARDLATLWLAFDRSWSDVGELVRRMVADSMALLLEIARSEPKRERIVLDGKARSEEIRAAIQTGADVIIRGRDEMRATLDAIDEDCICLSPLEDERSPVEGFGADVLRKGGERLDFPAPVTPTDAPDSTWAKILAELDRGADVTLRAGRYDSRLLITISHQPEGSNFFPDPEQASRFPRVQLGWSCPRPALPASTRLLGDLGADLLARAGDVDGNLGGVLLATGRMQTPGSFETRYEDLIGARMRAGEPTWLATHVRSPGHRVLVPAAAAAALKATPNVDQRKLAHGVLLSTAGEDPFTAEREPMERAVLPLVGSREELAPSR